MLKHKHLCSNISISAPTEVHPHFVMMHMHQTAHLLVCATLPRAGHLCQDSVQPCFVMLRMHQTAHLLVCVLHRHVQGICAQLVKYTPVAVTACASKGPLVLLACVQGICSVFDKEASAHFSGSITPFQVRAPSWPTKEENHSADFRLNRTRLNCVHCQ